MSGSDLIALTIRQERTVIMMIVSGQSQVSPLVIAENIARLVPSAF